MLDQQDRHTLLGDPRDYRGRPLRSPPRCSRRPARRAAAASAIGGDGAGDLQALELTIGQRLGRASRSAMSARPTGGEQVERAGPACLAVAPPGRRQVQQVGQQSEPRSARCRPAMTFSSAVMRSKICRFWKVRDRPRRGQAERRLPVPCTSDPSKTACGRATAGRGRTCMLNKRRLAGPVRPDNGDDLARLAPRRTRSSTAVRYRRNRCPDPSTESSGAAAHAFFLCRAARATSARQQARCA